MESRNPLKSAFLSRGKPYQCTTWPVSKGDGRFHQGTKGGNLLYLLAVEGGFVGSRVYLQLVLFTSRRSNAHTFF